MQKNCRKAVPPFLLEKSGRCGAPLEERFPAPLEGVADKPEIQKMKKFYWKSGRFDTFDTFWLCCILAWKPGGGLSPPFYIKESCRRRTVSGIFSFLRPL